jgi:hypothetical protein
MSDACAYCQSTGHVLSLDSVANRIERMLRRVHHYTRARQVRLVANPRLTLFLREDRWERMRELMGATGVSLDLVDDPRLHREDFRLLSVETGEDLMRRVASVRTDGGGGLGRRDGRPLVPRRGRSPEAGSPAVQRPGAAAPEGRRRPPRRQAGDAPERRDPGRRRRSGGRGRPRRGRPILEENPRLGVGGVAVHAEGRVAPVTREPPGEGA